MKVHISSILYCFARFISSFQDSSCFHQNDVTVVKATLHCSHLLTALDMSYCHCTTVPWFDLDFRFFGLMCCLQTSKTPMFCLSGHIPSVPFHWIHQKILVSTCQSVLSHGTYSPGFFMIKFLSPTFNQWSYLRNLLFLKLHSGPSIKNP